MIRDYLRDDVISMLGLSPRAVDRELERYENDYADLYLIAQCIRLKAKGEDVILITEENRNDDRKIIPKLPVICNKEGIRFQKIPQALFHTFRHELRFSLEIADSQTGTA